MTLTEWRAQATFYPWDRLSADHEIRANAEADEAPEFAGVFEYPGGVWVALRLDGTYWTMLDRFEHSGPTRSEVDVHVYAWSHVSCGPQHMSTSEPHPKGWDVCPLCEQGRVVLVRTTVDLGSIVEIESDEVLAFEIDGDGGRGDDEREIRCTVCDGFATHPEVARFYDALGVEE